MQVLGRVNELGGGFRCQVQHRIHLFVPEKAPAMAHFLAPLKVPGWQLPRPVRTALFNIPSTVSSPFNEPWRR
jgi:hypothetical protein